MSACSSSSSSFAAPPAPPLAVPPPAPVPATAPALCMGTLNVGLGFMRKLPRILTRCAELTLDAVALQEIGDPALLSTRLPSYQLVCAAGPSAHEAGVGLLLSLTLAPRIRRYFRSVSGRLVGAVLELSPGRTVLLVSAYMPSGLDHSFARDGACMVATAGAYSPPCARGARARPSAHSRRMETVGP